MAEDAESSIADKNCKNEMGGRLPYSKNLSKAGYITLEIKLAFIHLRQEFIKAAILRHFDPECYIRIETVVSGYAISRILNQLISNNLGQWHPVAYFFQKIIPAKTCYKAHNGKFLVIVKAFKTWKHYLKGWK